MLAGNFSCCFRSASSMGERSNPIGTYDVFRCCTTRSSSGIDLQSDSTDGKSFPTPCSHISYLIAIFLQFILKITSNTQTCFDELELYLKEMIAQRRSESIEIERHDLFSKLLHASDSETNDEKKLSTSELMGNIL